MAHSRFGGGGRGDPPGLLPAQRPALPRRRGGLDEVRDAQDPGLLRRADAGPWLRGEHLPHGDGCRRRAAGAPRGPRHSHAGHEVHRGEGDMDRCQRPGLQPPLTLGPDPGRNRVEAAVGGLAVTFPLSGSVGVGTPMPVMEGDSQWKGTRRRCGSISYSPDGRCLAVGSRTGIWLYDAATAREAALLPAGGGHPFPGLFSWFQLQSGPGARLEVFALTGQRVAVLHQGPGEAGGCTACAGTAATVGGWRCSPAGQRRLRVPAGDGRGRADAQADPVALKVADSLYLGDQDEGIRFGRRPKERATHE